LLAACIFIASTIISRVTYITGTIAGIKLLHAKIIRIGLTKTLSAIASSIFPKSVTKLYFLARYPSKKSVKLAITNITPAII